MADGAQKFGAVGSSRALHWEAWGLLQQLAGAAVSAGDNPKECEEASRKSPQEHWMQQARLASHAEMTESQGSSGHSLLRGKVNQQVLEAAHIP